MHTPMFFSRRFLIGLAAVVVAAAVGTATVALADPSGPISIVPRPTIVPKVNAVTEAPIFKSTGGPYIGEAAALAAAAKIAHGPIARQEVRFLKYRDWVTFTGDRTTTIDLDREVYVVVTSGTFIGRSGSPTCESYLAVLDATTGDGLSVMCGQGTWPSRLPDAFH